MRRKHSLDDLIDEYVVAVQTKKDGERSVEARRLRQRIDGTAYRHDAIEAAVEAVLRSWTLGGQLYARLQSAFERQPEAYFEEALVEGARRKKAGR
jgi:uncharacterized protein (UPF0128 family)